MAQLDLDHRQKSWNLSL